MKRLHFLILLLALVVGCKSISSAVEPVPSNKLKEQKQDFEFQLAINSLVKTSHEEEMTAIEEQRVLLESIATSVAALETPSEPVKPSAEPADTNPVPLPSDASSEASSAEDDLEWPSDYRIVYWYGTPCQHCPPVTEVVESLKKDGVRVRKIEAFSNSEEYGTVWDNEAVKYKVSDVPQVWVVDGNTAVKVFVGKVTRKDIREFVRENSKKHSVKMKSVVRSKVVRTSGPRWSWNGSWNVGREYAANHLEQEHGIDTEGLSMEELQILHDNAHNNGNTNQNQSSFSNQRIQYSVPVRNQRIQYSGPIRRFFQSNRFHCPGGNCP